MSKKVRVKSIVSLEKLYEEKEKRQLIINPVNTLAVNTLPSKITFVLSFIISGIDKGTHTFAIAVKEHRTGEVVLSIPERPFQGTLPGVNAQVGIDIENALVKAAGQYDIFFNLDGEIFTDDFEIEKI